MTKIDKKIIEECAENLLFNISSKEEDVLLNEFNAIIAQMSFLGKIENIDSAEPMTFPTEEHYSYLREDIPSIPVDPKEELKNVSSKLGNQVKLPKVVQ